MLSPNTVASNKCPAHSQRKVTPGFYGTLILDLDYHHHLLEILVFNANAGLNLIRGPVLQHPVLDHFHKVPNVWDARH